MGAAETADVIFLQCALPPGAGAAISAGLQIMAATLTAGAIMGALIGAAAWLVPRLWQFEGDLFDFGADLYEALLASPRRDLYYCAALAAGTAVTLCVSLRILSRGFLTFPLTPASLLPFALGAGVLTLTGCAARFALGPRGGRSGSVRLSASAWAIALLGIGISLLLYVIDRNYYVRLYSHMHLFIAAFAYLAIFEALVAVRSAFHPGAPRARRVLGAALAALWVGSGVFAALNFDAREDVKAFLLDRTTYAKRLYPILAKALPPFRPRPAAPPGAAPGARTETALPGEPAGAFRGANVVLISIDALRADRLGVSGNPRGLTPNLDRFAKGAILFTHAYAQGSNTFPSMASLMTGRQPGALDWPEGVGPPLGESNVTLAEILRGAGYDTGAVTPHRYFGDEWGLAQGFEHHDNSLSVYNRDNRGIVSRRIPAKARAIFAQLRPPFFLWVHFYDPHAHYMPHPGSPFAGSDADLYDGEVADTDAYAGELIDWLEDRAGRNTLIVVTGDHGEEFGEHGGQFHGTTLYEEVTRVPLIVRAPGSGGRVVQSPVSLVDLAPTLLDALGVDAPPNLSGRSLARALSGEPLPRPAPPVFSEATQLAAKAMVVRDGWKLIRDTDHDTWELYDLEADPAETRNLYDLEPGRARRLRALLESRPGREAAGGEGS
ncbi:MAG: sulfatase [Myxococcota bacterium]